MICSGSRVSISGKESVGTVLEVQNGFAKVSVNSQVTWNPIDDLTRYIRQIVVKTHRR